MGRSTDEDSDFLLVIKQKRSFGQNHKKREDHIFVFDVVYCNATNTKI